MINPLDNSDPDDISSDSEEFQCVADIDTDSIESEDNFIVSDIEDNYIDKCFKFMNTIMILFDTFDNEPLDNIMTVKRNMYVFCEENRYIIDDNIILQDLEKEINEKVTFYENKLHIFEEQCINNEGTHSNFAPSEHNEGILRRFSPSEHNEETQDLVINKETHRRCVPSDQPNTNFRQKKSMTEEEREERAERIKRDPFAAVLAKHHIKNLYI